MVIKSFSIHNKGVNQTIKLKIDNLYASCSNDKTIKIWQYDFKDNNSNIIIKDSFNSNNNVLCLCELPNLNFVSMANNYLIFWKKTSFFSHEEEKILKGFKKCLHNCLFILKCIFNMLI